MDGTAKYYYKSGAVETRIYENGVLQVNIMSSSNAKRKVDPTNMKICETCKFPSIQATRVY